jgi:hypothetical protein
VGKSIQQRGLRIIRQMVQKLANRIYSLLAGWASRHNYALAALRDRWRVLYEMAEVMLVDFLLYRAEQFGLEHSLSWMERKREGRIARFR